MHKLLFISCVLILSFSAIADSKMSVDLSIDKLNYHKPNKGIGEAGVLIFKTANVNNNGIVLNVTNANDYFNSQIFIRPTFLGFVTQFGNYGFPLSPDTFFNTLNQAELLNSKLVLDDNQLNLSGEAFSFVDNSNNVKLKTFRLYCQSAANFEGKPNIDVPTGDIMTNCFNFLTLNGNYIPNNDMASVEYTAIDKNEKTFIQAQVKSFDLRKSEIKLNLVTTKTVSNDSYFINTNNLNLTCAKDEDLKTLDFEKIKTACLNRLKIAPVKASLFDKTSKTNFNLDVKDITVKDKIVYFSLNEGSLSDTLSTTYLNNLLLNCKKELNTDLLDLTMVIKDCISFARISIDEVKSTKPDEKDSSIKKISLTSSNGVSTIQAQVKFLGIKANISIYANMALNEVKKQLIITVTDTRLPMGINSVKLLMYFLKKNLISKEISITNNVITIQL